MFDDVGDFGLEKKCYKMGIISIVQEEEVSKQRFQ